MRKIQIEKSPKMNTKIIFQWVSKITGYSVLDGI